MNKKKRIGYLLGAVIIALTVASCPDGTFNPFKVLFYYPTENYEDLLEPLEDISILFNEKPEQSSTIFALTIYENDEEIAGSITFDDHEMMFKPDIPFNFSKSYQVILTTEAENIYGTNLSQELNYEFPKTNQARSLTILAESLNENEIEIKSDEKIEIEFSKAVFIPSFLETVYFDPYLSGSWLFEKNSTLFYPKQLPKEKTIYQLHIPKDVKDEAGNSLEEEIIFSVTLLPATPIEITSIQTESSETLEENIITPLASNKPLFHIHFNAAVDHPSFLNSIGQRGIYQYQEESSSPIEIVLKAIPENLKTRLTIEYNWFGVNGVKAERQYQYDYTIPPQDKIKIEALFLLEDPLAEDPHYVELINNSFEDHWPQFYEQYQLTELLFYCQSTDASAITDISIINSVNIYAENNALMIQQCGIETNPFEDLSLLPEELPNGDKDHIFFKIMLRIQNNSQKGGILYITSAKGLENENGVTSREEYSISIIKKG